MNADAAGEVQSDALLWTAAAVALALYAESQGARAAEREDEAVILVADEHRGHRARRHPYAEVIWADMQVEKTTFFSPPESSFQFGLLAHEAGYDEAPHYHKAVAREIDDLQQMFVVQRGVVDVQLYDDDGRLFREVASAGDAIVLIHGVHAIRVIEDMQAISVKQGPFLGDEEDKVESSSRPPLIPVFEPVIGEEEIEAVAAAVRRARSRARSATRSARVRARVRGVRGRPARRRRDQRHDRAPARRAGARHRPGRRSPRQRQHEHRDRARGVHNGAVAGPGRLRAGRPGTSTSTWSRA